MKIANRLALIVLVLGGLNWGLVGLIRFDAVFMIFGPMTDLTRATYTVIGFCAAYIAVVSPKLMK